MEETIPLKILLIADGRSPITRRWITMLKPLGHRISLVSSYPCPPIEGVENLYILPLAFSRFGGSQAGGSGQNRSSGIISRIRPAAQKLRHWLGPWTLNLKSGELQRIIDTEKPDILHAMRIPFEGMLASYDPPGIPLIISTWGNDFTLHAPSTPRMRALTRKCMTEGICAHVGYADGCFSVLQNGDFAPHKPTLVVPGNGGIDLRELKQCHFTGSQNPTVPTVLNPRGLRSYVRSEPFSNPSRWYSKTCLRLQFSCTSMADQPEAENWINALGIESQCKAASCFSRRKSYGASLPAAHVSVSISSHDGTPNTLLEAMAAGCLPICGDLPSIREWITPGENGLLVDPQDPKALAEAILLGLTSTTIAVFISQA